MYTCISLAPSLLPPSSPVTLRSVCDILEVSAACSAAQLKRACLQFIGANAAALLEGRSALSSSSIHVHIHVHVHVHIHTYTVHSPVHSACVHDVHMYMYMEIHVHSTLA